MNQRREESSITRISQDNGGIPKKVALGVGLGILALAIIKSAREMKVKAR